MTKSSNGASINERCGPQRQDRTVIDHRLNRMPDPTKDHCIDSGSEEDAKKSGRMRTACNDALSNPGELRDILAHSKHPGSSARRKQRALPTQIEAMPLRDKKKNAVTRMLIGLLQIHHARCRSLLVAVSPLDQRRLDPHSLLT